MLQAAQTIFLSIILESLPFILLGVLISSLIQEFVSQATLLRLMPKNRAVAVFVSTLLGLVVPVCDCGTVPVARRLIAKGLPMSAAMAFTLAAPVVNPLTMIATYVAFGMNPTMMLARTATTLSIALAIGWVLLYLEPKNRNLSFQHELHMIEMAATQHEANVHAPERNNDHAIEHDQLHGHAHNHSHDLTHHFQSKRTLRQVLSNVIRHTIIEFFEVGVFVVFSAAVAALLQTAFPAALLATVSQHPVGSVAAMMLLGMILSLCSEADAFVARSLAGLTTNGGMLGFLVIGQMIDLRNLLLLPRVFPKKVVISTFVLALLLTLYAGIWVNLIA